MKQPKKLTRKQKELLKANGFNESCYSLKEETKEYYIFINKNTGNTVSIIKVVQ